ncbi:MAG: peptidyl-prolyl cis-trans isomerase [Terriglobia bacterium]
MSVKMRMAISQAGGAGRALRPLREARGGLCGISTFPPKGMEKPQGWKTSLALRAFCFSLCLSLLAVCSASAQVPSHTPSSVPDAFSDTATFRPVGRTLVRVNGAVLTDRDLLREMYTIFPYARVHNGFPKAMEADIRAGAMKMMIFEELVYQEAERRHMTVPPAQLAHAQAEFRRQFNSPQEYQQFVQEEFHGSQKLLQAKVERSLLIDKFLKEEVTDKAPVTVAEAKAYYDQHPESFHVPESFAFQSITFLPPRNATAAQVKEARQRAEDARAQAQAAKSYEAFGLLAQKISEDDFRVMMGDHKAVDLSKLPPPVVKALLGMQPGQVSGVVELDVSAYTILRLTAHIPAGIQQFETIKDSLREQLAQQKTEQLRQALATKLSKDAKIEKS